MHACSKNRRRLESKNNSLNESTKVQNTRHKCGLASDDIMSMMSLKCNCISIDAYYMHCLALTLECTDHHVKGNKPASHVS